MTDLVSSSDIEKIVGIERHDVRHYARADSSERKVYILHSHMCLELIDDLRDCMYSLALDRGIRESEWSGREDAPVMVSLRSGRVVPAV